MSSPGWAIGSPARPACLICGDDRDVRMGMMRYREPDDEGNRYASGWRCRDHDACRARFEAVDPRATFPLDEARSRVVFVGEDPAG